MRSLSALGALATVDRDGANPQRLTDDAYDDDFPDWSPDGRQIVYASQETGNYSLHLMDSKGGDRRRITSPQPPYWDARPQIAADGKSIAFNRSDGKTIAIYTLRLPAS